MLCAPNPSLNLQEKQSVAYFENSLHSFFSYYTYRPAPL